MQIPEPYRKRFYALRDDVTARFCRSLRADNEKCLKSMIQYGLKQAVMPESSREAIEKKVRPPWDKLAGEFYPKDVLEQIIANLAEFRAKNK
jgi:hypothetical protein